MGIGDESEFKHMGEGEEGIDVGVRGGVCEVRERGRVHSSEESIGAGAAHSSELWSRRGGWQRGDRRFELWSRRGGWRRDDKRFLMSWRCGMKSVAGVLGWLGERSLKSLSLQSNTAWMAHATGGRIVVGVVLRARNLP